MTMIYVALKSLEPQTSTVTFISVFHSKSCHVTLRYVTLSHYLYTTSRLHSMLAAVLSHSKAALVCWSHINSGKRLWEPLAEVDSHTWMIWIIDEFESRFSLSLCKQHQSHHQCFVLLHNQRHSRFISQLFAFAY